MFSSPLPLEPSFPLNSYLKDFRLSEMWDERKLGERMCRFYGGRLEADHRDQSDLLLSSGYSVAFGSYSALWVAVGAAEESHQEKEFFGSLVRRKRSSWAKMHLRHCSVLGERLGRVLPLLVPRGPS